MVSYRNEYFRIIYRIISLLSLQYLCLLIYPVSAQIIPDSTLGNNQSVVQQSQSINENSSSLITGGIRNGSNLLHSFREFNVRERQSVLFENPPAIDTIISRVTGNDSTQILGLLGVQGRARLFLLNSNGFLFGPNATLSLNNSFLVSTANKIGFLDESVLSTKPSSNNVEILSSSRPSRLVFDSRAGQIRVNGLGNNLSDLAVTPIDNPIDAPRGLSVFPSSDIALIGGNVNFNSGALRSFGGNIEIASVRQGDVLINDSLSNQNFDFSDVNSFLDISLSNRSLIDSSGSPGGNITLSGNNISLESGSVLLIQNFGDRPSGGIQVNAIGNLNLLNIAEDGRFSSPAISAVVENQNDARIASTFITDNLGSSTGGDIIVRSESLSLRNGGQISTRTFLDGNAGDINIDTRKKLNVLDSSPEFPIFFSNISSVTFGLGASGEVRISADQLLATNGGVIGSATFGPGPGGTVNVLARDIRLAGILPLFLFPSSINAATFGPGDAGQLMISSDTLSLFDSARIGTSTVGIGNAGTVNINASESIFIGGSNPISLNPSLIDSSANITGPTFEDELGALPVPLGNAGGLTINTKNLSIVDGGLISVNNDGIGNAGNITLNTNSLALDNFGSISASTESGNGGNIQVQSEILIVDDSSIAASARGFGVGGNIAINSPLLVGVGESRISANAEQSIGGRINIETLGIFGQNFQITATSDLGPQFDGQVEIDTENRPVAVDQIEVRQPVSTAIKLNCSPDGSGEQSSFAIRGSGGFPVQASNYLQTAPFKSGVAKRDVSVHLPFMLDKQSGEKIYLAEPRGFIRHKDGTLAFAVEAQKRGLFIPGLQFSAPVE